MTDDFGAYNNFKNSIGEKFCAVVNGVNGVISSACGDLRIEREHDGSITLSRRAAQLLTGVVQSAIPAQLQPNPRERALERAALDFIHKVDRGEARSKNSYAAFKAALALPSTECPSPAPQTECGRGK